MGQFNPAKVITVDVSTRSVSQLLERARSLAAKEKITIAGTDREGTVQGHNIDGDYQVSGSFLRIRIRRTPNAPWFIVRSLILGFVNGKG